MANSVPTTVFLQQFMSLGHLVHFEGGTALSLIGPLRQSVRGRVYELNQQTTGGADLTRDNGFNFGADARVSMFDVWASFTHSVHFDLNFLSFGIGVNMRSLIHRGV